jgi:hypothetical protein
MIKDIARDASQACPLLITRVEWEDPTFLIGGGNWSFTTTNAWRLIVDNNLVTGFDDSKSVSILAQLLNLEVSSFKGDNSGNLLDFEIEFSNNYHLQIFGTHRGENWILRTPNQPTAIFVPNI